MELSDEQLVSEYVEGGKMTSLDTLVVRHAGNVRNFIYPMVLNKADTDDLTQETFIKVAASLPKFQYRSCFKTWLYRIAVNTTRSFLRKKGNLVFEFLPDSPELNSCALSPAGAAISREESARLLTLIARLSPCLRRAFVLVGVHELSAREAAELEGCLTATIYRRVHMARRQLQKWIKT